jgi:gamma-glutamylcyclotransferase (GGCT)/AIG2-like uncharacterized protein YtfP
MSDPSAAGAPCLLLVYGTLMRGFPLHRLLEGRAAFAGAGAVRGKLYDLGAYPGAVPAGSGLIRGEVYEVSDPALWRVLDSAEGPQYHRREASVTITGSGDRAAFVYWYVGPLGRAVPIPDGDYRAHVPARSIHRT